MTKLLKCNSTYYYYLKKTKCSLAFHIRFNVMSKMIRTIGTFSTIKNMLLVESFVNARW